MTKSEASSLEGVQKLLSVMARLRAPGGCPWDLEQTHQSLAKDLLEEAYETVEAIESGDLLHLREELGDLLLQVVFHAQIAEESGHFDFDGIARHEADKMIERHPHVFGDRDGVKTAQDVLTNWEADKAQKRAAEGVLDGVSVALPALARALKLQQRAARVGFDWSDPKDILGKIREETEELAVEIASGKSKEAMTDELGDLFFVLVNLARHLKIDPETALRGTNAKFEARFRFIEKSLAAQGRDARQASLEEMEALWQAAKGFGK